MKINKIKYFVFIISLFSIIYIPSISFAQRGVFDPGSNFTVPTQVSPIAPNNPIVSTNQITSSTLLCTLKSSPKLGDLLGYITCMISRSVIPLIFALATASFIWGVVQYVINNDDEGKKAKGRTFMIWGIIALTVMVSVWGLVSILGNTFGIQNIIPQLK